MRIFIEPLTKQQEIQLENNDEEMDEKFNYEPLDEEKLTLYELYTQSYLNDKLVEGPVAVNKESMRWDVFYQLEKSPLPQDQVIELFKRLRYYQSTVFLPQSDETPSFLERFKLDKSHYHQERKLRAKKRKEEQKLEKGEGKKEAVIATATATVIEDDVNINQIETKKMYEVIEGLTTDSNINEKIEKEKK